MKFLKNSFGFSLVEVIIGLGLMAATAYMFALQSKLQTQSESKFRTQQSLNDLEIEISRNFADKAVCEHALGAAFIDETFNEESILGNEDHKKLYKKGFNNAFPELGIVNSLFQEGRIRVGDIIYELSNIENVENKPLEKTAELALKVTFERCSQGGVIGSGLVYDGTSVNGGGIINGGSRSCKGVSGITKTFRRDVSLNINQENKITSIKCMGVALNDNDNDNGNGNGNGNGDEDQQDEDDQGEGTGSPSIACKNEAKVLLKNELVGLTSCGWTLTTTPMKTEYLTPITNQVFAKPNMMNYVSGSMHFTIQGAGGGGKNGNSVGPGGEAGMVVRGKITDDFLISNYVIKITVGMGGKGACITCNPQTWNALAGEASSIKIYPNGQSVAIKNYIASGGHPGRADVTSVEWGNYRHGMNGAPSHFALGGSGAYYVHTNDNQYIYYDAQPGTLGSGGGGGAYINGANTINGANGGDGFVWIEWLEYTAVDQDGNSVDVFSD